MCTVLYCTVLYCTVLYCTVLYCTALYCCHRVSTQLQLTNRLYINIKSDFPEISNFQISFRQYEICLDCLSLSHTHTLSLSLTTFPLASYIQGCTGTRTCLRHVPLLQQAFENRRSEERRRATQFRHRNNSLIFRHTL